MDSYRRQTWDVAYGSSGTVGAVGDVLAAAGWPSGTVKRAGLNWLLENLVRTKSSDKVRLDGMKEDRRALLGAYGLGLFGVVRKTRFFRNIVLKNLAWTPYTQVANLTTDQVAAFEKVGIDLFLLQEMRTERNADRPFAVNEPARPHRLAARSSSAATA